MAVIFISHKLDEVLAISDEVAVLRAGRLVARLPARGTDKAALGELMVGREVRMPEREAVAPGPVRLALRGAGAAAADGRAALHGVDLEVRGGEIVAIAGVAGNGQGVLADLLHGLLPLDAGSMSIDGRSLPPRPRAWTAAGVGRVPEDRQGRGVVGGLPLWENAVIEQYRAPRFARAGWVRRTASRAHAESLVQRFDVRAAGLDAPTASLSGGNIQKLVLARMLEPSPGVIVVDQPTWGLDVGAVAFVHAQLLEARRRGAAIVLISEDLDEVFALADRIAVMHQGHLGPALPAAEWTLASIGLAMAGARH